VSVGGSVAAGGEVGVSGTGEDVNGVDVSTGVAVGSGEGVSVASEGGVSVGAWAVSSACTVWATAVSSTWGSCVGTDTVGNLQANAVRMRAVTTSDKTFVRIGISLPVDYHDPHGVFIVTHFLI